MRSTIPFLMDRRTELLLQTGHSPTLLAKVRCMGSGLSVRLIMTSRAESASVERGALCAADILTLRAVKAAGTIRGMYRKGGAINALEGRGKGGGEPDCGIRNDCRSRDWKNLT